MSLESTLNQLRLLSPEGQLPPSYGVYFKNTLVALCHALEDHLLEQEAPDQPLVLVTFQQGKWYLQEAQRYAQLAQASSLIVIGAVSNSGFRDHPTGKLDNVTLVDLAPEDSLGEEWNLIIIAPNYGAMVLCHELKPEEYRLGSEPTADTERKFYGLWTFDRALVVQAAQILINRMTQPDSALAFTLNQHLEDINQTKVDQSVDLTGVVHRIVSYLQNSEERLITVNRQTKEFQNLEGQALKLSRNLGANKLQAFLRMAQKVDQNDPYNPHASLQVSALAETLGQILDVSVIQLRRLRLAGLLFRVGLAQAPSAVFTQHEDDLDTNNYSLWRDRAVLSSRLLSAMNELEPITKIIYHQLEHWDGSGSPDGLKGENIPLESRILGLVTYFQHLIHPRGKRPAYDLSTALEQCEKASNIKFEPKLVESLKTVVRLTEMGFMTLPDQPSQLPQVWLES